MGGYAPLFFCLRGGSCVIESYVSTDYSALTWATVLLVQEDKGLKVKGLVEDCAKAYPLSLTEAELNQPVQKDTWHILNGVSKTLSDLERATLRQIKEVYILEAGLERHWDDQMFEKYVEKSNKMELMLEQCAQFRFLYSCLHDAFEIVDWRNGDIRDKEIAQWYIEKIIKELRVLSYPGAKRIAKELERQKENLLTFFSWLEVQFTPWQQEIKKAIPDDYMRNLFQAAIARTWRLKKAVLNGNKNFISAAEDAEALLCELIAYDEDMRKLAQSLLCILENTIRTSCMSETINSVLKRYLHIKKSFQSQETAQNFLYLFALWHNIRAYKRGKRKGKSPFSMLGIDMGTNDWLELLGCPKENIC